MNVYVEPGRNFTEEVKYVWRIWGVNRAVEIHFADHPANADIRIAITGSDFPLSLRFYDAIKSGPYVHDHYFKKDCHIRDAEGRIDHFATAFYMINSLQEYGADDVDEVGRFKFSNSYQSKYHCITKNLVQETFDAIGEAHPFLATLPANFIKSGFFLSHDIDSVNGALLQDGFYLVKKMKPHTAFGIVMNAVLQRPDWLNMDRIMTIEDEYDFKSTFFWIVNKGRINKREVNADYDIHDRKIRDQISRIESRGWQNGLHKSISSESIKSEMAKTGFSPVANRHHYLKFSLPALYDAIEDSGLRMDASLGFAEAFGFRNNYGLPFTPFNVKERKPYSFVEVPLHIMDGTFQKYLDVPKEKTAEAIIDFLEKNKMNCLLSILWHNTLFTDYKFGGYLEVYKKILGYLYESKFDCINTNEIIERYSLPR